MEGLRDEAYRIYELPQPSGAQSLLLASSLVPRVYTQSLRLVRDDGFILSVLLLPVNVQITRSLVNPFLAGGLECSTVLPN